MTWEASAHQLAATLSIVKSLPMSTGLALLVEEALETYGVMVDGQSDESAGNQ